jgi:hypothetical protein
MRPSMTTATRCIVCGVGVMPINPDDYYHPHELHCKRSDKNCFCDMYVCMGCDKEGLRRGLYHYPSINAP